MFPRGPRKSSEAVPLRTTSAQPSHSPGDHTRRAEPFPRGPRETFLRRGDPWFPGDHASPAGLFPRGPRETLPGGTNPGPPGTTRTQPGYFPGDHERPAESVPRGPHDTTLQLERTAVPRGPRKSSRAVPPGTTRNTPGRNEPRSPGDHAHSARLFPWGPRAPSRVGPPGTTRHYPSIGAHCGPPGTTQVQPGCSPGDHAKHSRAERTPVPRGPRALSQAISLGTTSAQPSRSPGDHTTLPFNWSALRSPGDRAEKLGRSPGDHRYTPGRNEPRSPGDHARTQPGYFPGDHEPPAESVPRGPRESGPQLERTPVPRGPCEKS